MIGNFIRTGSQSVTSDPDVSRSIVTNQQRDLLCLQKVKINVFPEFASLSAASVVWQWAHKMHDVCWANAHFITEKTKRNVAKKNRRYKSLADRLCRTNVVPCLSPAEM